MADETKPKQQTIEEEAGLPENWQAVSSAPVIPGRSAGGPVGSPPAPSSIDNFQSGQLPPFLGLQPDLVSTGDPGPRIPTTRLMPIMPSGVSQNVSAVKSVATPLIPSFPPTTPTKQVTDGLIHGDAIWEIDPAYVLLRDDFINVNQTGGIGSFISELPWFIAQASGGDSVFVGGGNFPYQGLVEISNNSTAGDATFFQPQVQLPPAQVGMPLLDYPGWKLIWIFKIGRIGSGSPASTFSWTQVSNYIGLANYPGIGSDLTPGNSPRPPMFLGLRYDTDTTSPAISDTQFVFEYVMNATATPATRDNTQGTVVPTGIIPTEGNSYRLEISCTTSGTINFLLTDGTTLFTTAMLVTQFTTTSVPSITNGGTTGMAFASYSTPLPWGAGSIFTIAGGTFADINGTWTNIPGSFQSTTAEWYFITSSSGSDTGATTSVYPAFLPFISFGNDTTAAPVAESKAIGVDYFGFVWNPGVGGGKATPNPLLPRYF